MIGTNEERLSALERQLPELRAELQKDMHAIAASMERRIDGLGSELKVILLRNEREEKARLRQERTEALERSGEYRRQAEEAQKKLAEKEKLSPVVLLRDKCTPWLLFLAAFAGAAGIVGAAFKYLVWEAIKR
jgi:hypothetical protein